MQSVQAALELHSCSVLAVAAAAVGEEGGGAAFSLEVGAHHTGDGLIQLVSETRVAC